MAHGQLPGDYDHREALAWNVTLLAADQGRHLLGNGSLEALLTSVSNMTLVRRCAVLVSANDLDSANETQLGTSWTKEVDPDTGMDRRVVHFATFFELVAPNDRYWNMTVLFGTGAVYLLVYCFFWAQVLRFFCTRIGAESIQKTDLELVKFLEGRFEGKEELLNNEDLLSIVSSEQDISSEDSVEELYFINRSEDEDSESGSDFVHAVHVDKKLALRKRLRRKECRFE